MTGITCRYCGGNNLTITDQTFGVTYDYVGSDGCYCCEDCFVTLEGNLEKMEAFLIDYLEICKKHEICIANLGWCHGKTLYESEKNFLTELVENVGELKGGTIKKLKENIHKKRLKDNG
jgi:hypothetical protein